MPAPAETKPRPLDRDQMVAGCCQQVVDIAQWDGPWPMDVAGQDKLLRAARRAVHPDAHGGDQTMWDAVERAAALSGLLGGVRQYQALKFWEPAQQF